MSLRKASALALFGLLMLSLAHTPVPLSAGALNPADGERIARFKALQQRRLMDGARARLNRYLVARGQRLPGPARGSRRRGPLDQTEAGGAQGTDRVTTPAPPSAGKAGSAYTNVLINDRATDTAICGFAPCTGLPWSGQCEVSIAAHGNNLVAAWNDGEGFVTGSSTQG